MPYLLTHTRSSVWPVTFFLLAAIWGSGVITTAVLGWQVAPFAVVTCVLLTVPVGLSVWSMWRRCPSAFHREVTTRVVSDDEAARMTKGER